MLHVLKHDSDSLPKATRNKSCTYYPPVSEASREVANDIIIEPLLYISVAYIAFQLIYVHITIQGYI